MKKYLFAFIGTMLVFLALEAIWLGYLAKDFYATQLAGLLRPEIKLLPALAFYLIYGLAIVYLVVIPRLKEGVWQVMLTGALLGLTAYGTYDLTNLAILANWPLAVTLVDLTWGVVLTSAASLGGYLLASRCCQP
jgi:uncharacterized membrane protein